MTMTIGFSLGHRPLDFASTSGRLTGSGIVGTPAGIGAIPSFIEDRPPALPAAAPAASAEPDAVPAQHPPGRLEPATSRPLRATTRPLHHRPASVLATPARERIESLPPDFAEALATTAAARWRGRRCHPANLCQATIALAALARLGRERLEDVKKRDLHRITAAWADEGLSPATTNKRLSLLSTLGVDVKGARVRNPNPRKWWLSPEMEERVVAEWSKRPRPISRIMLRFIVWTTRSGLRVEESLRLSPRDFSRTSVPDASSPNGSRVLWSLTVPGTKTRGAQATIPLSAEAAEVAEAVLSGLGPNEPVFPCSYGQLAGEWAHVRFFLGAEEDHLCTLKALRRSAARRLHVAGMPIDLLKQYLRHSEVSTTMGYLHLTGGYTEGEMRKFV